MVLNCMTQLHAQLCLQATHHYLIIIGKSRITMAHKTSTTAQQETTQLQSLSNLIFSRAVKMIGALIKTNLSILVLKAIARFIVRLVG